MYHKRDGFGQIQPCFLFRYDIVKELLLLIHIRQYVARSSLLYRFHIFQRLLYSFSCGAGSSEGSAVVQAPSVFPPGLPYWFFFLHMFPTAFLSPIFYSYITMTFQSESLLELFLRLACHPLRTKILNKWKRVSCGIHDMGWILLRDKPRRLFSYFLSSLQWHFTHSWSLSSSCKRYGSTSSKQPVGGGGGGDCVTFASVAYSSRSPPMMSPSPPPGYNPGLFPEGKIITHFSDQLHNLGSSDRAYVHPPFHVQEDFQSSCSIVSVALQNIHQVKVHCGTSQLTLTFLASTR